MIDVDSTTLLECLDELDKSEMPRTAKLVRWIATKLLSKNYEQKTDSKYVTKEMLVDLVLAKKQLPKE